MKIFGVRNDEVRNNGSNGIVPITPIILIIPPDFVTQKTRIL